MFVLLRHKYSTRYPQQRLTVCVASDRFRPMSVTGSTDFKETDTVIVDVSERLSVRRLRAISWPHGDDTVGPAYLPCLPPRFTEEQTAVPAHKAGDERVDDAHDLDEADLVSLSWLERLDARLDEWPPHMVWALLHAMSGASALCAVLIVIVLCLPALH
ncbi:MAG: hypothetical protein AAB570_01180 [Patescibacteria group bacterium]